MKDLSAPLSTQIEITEECNHECNFCYNFWDRDGKTNSLDREGLSTIINKLDNIGVFRCVITGGEPFLEKDNTFYTISEANKKGIEVSVNTNLTALNQTDIKELSRKDTSLLISCPSHLEDRYNAITNSKNYKKFERNLETVVETEIPASVNMVVTKQNKDEVYDLGEYLHEKFGIGSFSATPVNPSLDTHLSLMLSNEEIEDTFDSLIDLEKHYDIRVNVLDVIPNCAVSEKYWDKEWITEKGCGAGLTTMAIGASGEVRPCTYLNLEYGNILEQDFKDIWENMEKWRTEEVIPEDCETCDLVSRCRGGCKARSNILKGSYFNKDPYFEGPIELKKSQKELEPEKSYKLSELNIREERKNEYLITDGSGIIFGNKGMVKFMNALEEEGKIVPEDFIRENGLSKKSLNLLKYLHKKGFLEDGT